MPIHFYPHDRLFKVMLNESFKELRRNGYFARQNFSCCQSCAWAEIPEDKEEKVVFYHRQDTCTVESEFVWLAWAGDGKEIVSILKKYLDVEWGGTEHERILVKFSKAKHRVWNAENELARMRQINKKRPQQFELLEEKITSMHDRLDRAVQEIKSQPWVSDDNLSHLQGCLDQADFWTKIGLKEDADSWLKEAGVYL